IDSPEDIVLPRLRRAGLRMTDPVAQHLMALYRLELSSRIDDFESPHASPGALRTVIDLHRKLLRSEEYVDSRIADPSTGTLDHLHAELCRRRVIDLADRLALPPALRSFLELAAHPHDAERSHPKRRLRGERDCRGHPDRYRQF